MEVSHKIEYIVSSPEVRSGRPRIAGTGITVADVAIAKIFHGQTPEEIAEGYGVGLPQVYAALSYYYEHRHEIDESIRERRNRAAALKEQILARQSPSLLP